MNREYILLGGGILALAYALSGNGESESANSGSNLSGNVKMTIKKHPRLGQVPDFKYKVPPRRWYAKMRAINEQRYNDPSYKTSEEWDKIIRQQRESPIKIIEPRGWLNVVNPEYYWYNVLITREEYNKRLEKCVLKYYNRGINTLT